MRTTLMIGLRNLRRRPVRTILTGSTIFVGSLAIVLSVGLVEGTYRDMIRIGTRSFSGHFQVVAGDYQKKPSLFKTIDDAGAVEAAFKGSGFVEAVTTRVETFGLLSAGNRSAGVLLMGVDPARERKVTTLARAVEKGRWLDEGNGARRPVVLGSSLCRRLVVGVGDEVSFVSQAADGSIAAELYEVVGVVETGVEDLDRSLALIGLRDAQELLVLGNRVHRLVGVTSDVQLVNWLRYTVRLPAGLTFLDWEQVMPVLAQSIQADRSGVWFGLIVVMVVVVLGVFNTMTMSVLERTRELGVLSALGTTPRRIVGLIVGEAAWVSLVGVVSGVLLGVAGNAVLARWGISLGGETFDFAGVVIKNMYPTQTLMGNVLFPLAIFMSGVVAGLLPALRAARLKPASALRRF
jgi:putative ABC transport system permease protein